MSTFHTTQGYSIFEVVLALAVFSATLSLTAHTIIQSAGAYTQRDLSAYANALAEEAMVAIIALRDDDMDNLVAGTHGLVFAGGTWQLAGASDSTDDVYVRTVTITPRVLDEVDVEVVVQTPGMPENEVRRSMTLQDLYESYGDSGALDVEHLDASWDASHSILSGVTLHNVGSSTITITSLALSWTGGGGYTSIVVDGIEVFATASTSPILSGYKVDVAIPIFEGTTGVCDSISFTEPTTAEDITLIGGLSDGSSFSFYLSL